MKFVFQICPFLVSYNRRARMQPVMLVLLPVLIPPLFQLDFQLDWVAVRWLILYFGVTVLLIQLGRDRGKTKEKDLFERWGGKPSVAMLRHRDTRLIGSDKERYKDFLIRSVPKLHLASPEEEQKDPDSADDGYESATSWLLTKTRDRDQYPLIFEENINYGVRRNLWALRSWAFFIESISFVCMAAYASTFWAGEIFLTLQVMPELAWIWMLGICLHTFIFAFIATEKWVRIQAEAYARQLLAACDTIGRQTVN